MARGVRVAGLSIASFVPVDHGGGALPYGAISHLSYTHKPLGMVGRAGVAGMRGGDEIEREAITADEGGGFREGRKILREGHGEITAGLEISKSPGHEGEFGLMILSDRESVLRAKHREMHCICGGILSYG